MYVFYAFCNVSPVTASTKSCPCTFHTTFKLHPVVTRHRRVPYKKIQKHTQNKYLRAEIQAKTLVERTVKSFFALSAKSNFVDVPCATNRGTNGMYKIAFCTKSEK